MTDKNARFIKGILKIDSSYKEETLVVEPDKDFLTSHTGKCGSSLYWLNHMKNNDIDYKDCSSGDFKALADLIRALDVKQLQKIGKRSKEVYLEKYNKTLFIDRLNEELTY